jgi:alkylhydroperoxidase family enzyme
LEGYPQKLRKLVEGLFSGRGDSDPTVRRSVADRARALALAEEPGAVAAEITAYVDKVALSAYRVTDEDVAALKAAGYSEDAIFELTLSAAVGASLARMDRGLAAIGKGGK